MISAVYASKCAVCVLPITSGVILIYAVLSIRNYLKSMNEDFDPIRIKTVLIHSAAFVLYLLSNIC